jgi:hypothetical protein
VNTARGIFATLIMVLIFGFIFSYPSLAIISMKYNLSDVNKFLKEKNLNECYIEDENRYRCFHGVCEFNWDLNLRNEYRKSRNMTLINE